MICFPKENLHLLYLNSASLHLSAQARSSGHSQIFTVHVLVCDIEKLRVSLGQGLIARHYWIAYMYTLLLTDKGGLLKNYIDSAI